MIERIKETLHRMGLDGIKYISPRQIDLVALRSGCTQYDVVSYLISL